MKEIYFTRYKGGIVALWDKIPDYMLVVKPELSKMSENQFWLVDRQRPNKPFHIDYSLKIDPRILAACMQMFVLLDYGGIIYTQDQEGKRFMRPINSMMAPKKEFVMRLPLGVEKEWDYFSTSKEVSTLIDFLLNR